MLDTARYHLHTKYARLKGVEIMPDFKILATDAGRALGKAGMFIGRKTAEAYRSIDPDVVRHIAQLPLLSYSLFVARKETIEPGEPDGYPPLIFVHGLGGNRGNFLLMAGFFRLLGRKRSYKIHFDSGQSIEEMGQALAGMIEQVCEVTGESKVEIVAHSLGGIVARLAVQDYEIGHAVKTLVTLGTPHNGTYPARFANTDTIRLLRPGSDLMTHLNTSKLPVEVRMVSFFSANDLFVLPAESAIVEGGEAVNVTPFTHYSYLFDPKSWRRVWQVLQEDPSFVPR
jgi:triacylglycerol esterase/lipase EstA (alpha/beta hydrolase family)